MLLDDDWCSTITPDDDGAATDGDDDGDDDDDDDSDGLARQIGGCRLSVNSTCIYRCLAWQSATRRVTALRSR